MALTNTGIISVPEFLTKLVKPNYQHYRSPNGDLIAIRPVRDVTVGSGRVYLMFPDQKVITIDTDPGQEKATAAEVARYFNFKVVNDPAPVRTTIDGGLAWIKAVWAKLVQ